MNEGAVLDVRLHDSLIGTITLLPSDRSIFAFTQDYIDDAARPTLSLSFKDEFGELITDHHSTGPNLLPFFSNLLPEGKLRSYLAQQAKVKQVRELYLLWALGADLPGAVRITPRETDQWPEIAAADTAAPKESTGPLRFSLAGIQLKFSALKNNGKGGGLTIPAHGLGGSWIVKLPADNFENVPENEFSFMTLARSVGIDVPEIQLVDLDSISGLPTDLGPLRGSKAYAIKRFDRSDEGAVHIEDFAQVLGAYPEGKYKGATYRLIAKILGIETSTDDVREFIRRLIFSTLIGNGDMHLKNWSLIYYDRRTPSLAPAYDLLSTIAYIPGDPAALKYATTDKMAALDAEELKRLADGAKLPQELVLDTARQTVADFFAVWAEQKTELPFAKDVGQAIDAHLKTLQIVKETR